MSLALFKILYCTLHKTEIHALWLLKAQMCMLLIGKLGSTTFSFKQWHKWPKADINNSPPLNKESHRKTVWDVIRSIHNFKKIMYDFKKYESQKENLNQAIECNSSNKWIQR